jgi:exonuclease III
MGTERGLVKVATFNINNINKRLDNLLAWLAKAEPDVVSLQELKAEQEALPVNALRTLGYEAVWQGERSCGCARRRSIFRVLCENLDASKNSHFRCDI